MGPPAGPRELAGAQVDAPSQRDHYQEGTGGRTRREAGRVGLQEGPERRAWVRQEWMGLEAWPWWSGARGHPAECQRGWDLGLDGTEMLGHVGREAGLYTLGMNQQVSWGKGGLVQAEVSPGLGTPTEMSEPCSCRPAALPPGLFGWLRNASRANVSPGPGGETWRALHSPGWSGSVPRHGLSKTITGWTHSPAQTPASHDSAGSAGTACEEVQAPPGRTAKRKGMGEFVQPCKMQR